VLLVETQRRLTSRPYHRHKLVLVLSALRHYAERLRADGWQVHYRTAPSWRSALQSAVAETQATAVYTMAGAEYTPRQAQQRWHEGLGVPVHVLPNTMFLADGVTAPAVTRRQPMEAFYRAMRQAYRVLVEPDGTPTGGAWNYDRENRKPLPRSVTIPAVPIFPPDAVTRAVMTEVAALPSALGAVDDFSLAVTHADAQRALDAFVADRLPLFGRYEDAMTTRADVVFHSQLTPYLNLGLLTPLTLIDAAVAAYTAGMAPIASVEGFVRQVLGWREYMYRAYWQLMPALQTMNYWQATRPLPEWFWRGTSGMHCADTVVARVWQTGYTHHIERLMILTNICTLAGIDPVAVNEWFLAGYIDAYDWVMWPNVSGMGLYADGGIIATKPYIASGSYVAKMSDYCAGCRYDPQQRTGPDACPLTVLYWNFLLTHHDTLRANPRMGPAVLGLRYLTDDQRTTIPADAQRILASWGVASTSDTTP
jgi:deoxyribodipyrimidine photolyase-related protein